MTTSRSCRSCRADLLDRAHRGYRDLQIIRDLITLPAILAGLLANLTTGRVVWHYCALGIAVRGGLFLVIIVANGRGMGGGDMKPGTM